MLIAHRKLRPASNALTGRHAGIGSYGSRLHRTADGRFIGVAEWPDEPTWRAAFSARMVYDDPAVRAAFVDAIADGEPEPFLLMEVTDDLLVR